MVYDENDPIMFMALSALVWALTQGVGWLQKRTKLPEGTREALPFVALFIAVVLRCSIEAAQSGTLTWSVFWQGLLNGLAAVFAHVSSRPLRNRFGGEAK